MYDELVKRLRERSVFLFPHHGESRSYDADLMHEAADAIEELSKRVDESIPKNDAEIIIEELSKQHWIPVDEYGVLPDHYETVLLYIESEPEGYITIGSYDYMEMRWKDFCDVNREVYQADVVTHWMPLPDPPKEE